ncbi:ubiquitin carboxyl-terminal hydrolase 32 isoform X2 [Agrilus planipennis]|uniref:Ubiquitin carboxyl-terminal hydrolase 48 n=1 Tax=Agrilus planipennis TaxID=224129 RepID=A0A7F5RND7_AGRPL|nr:ubiquitin carboxyl-terminal hydrolase 32 isoform X2 [Agrilus planipennis]
MMGAKDSKRSCLSYEDAVKRMTDVEFKRVCEAFKRLTGGGQLLGKQSFTQNVLGDGVPVSIGEWLYTACGGTPRGIALRDLICGLVLLTKGSQEEKIKFLWTLYCNDSTGYITKNEFMSALQTEGTLPTCCSDKPNIEYTVRSLFGIGQDKVGFDHFHAWIQYNKSATILSRWLLANPCVSLSSELETPTFYQTLAGVTHLEEQDICELEKCFWSLTSSSQTGQLDLESISALVSPPVPVSACVGLFMALDVNGDGHVDFKELCCGISAACRGPIAERVKFCFKIFDVDKNGRLNTKELQTMIEILFFIAKENKLFCSSQTNNKHTFSTLERRSFSSHNRASFVIKSSNEKLKENDSETKGRKDCLITDIVKLPPDARTNEDMKEKEIGLMLIDNSMAYAQQTLDESHIKSLHGLKARLDERGHLNQEEFLIWGVDNNPFISPLLELLFEVGHVCLGLKPHCRHHEYDIVMGWLSREESRGYHVGQFWYLVSSDWWQSWLNYTTASKTSYDHCNCKADNSRIAIEEGIVCDESFSSTDYTSSHSNELTSNSTDSMGDLLSRGDSCSIASSSGVSSSSGNGSKRQQNSPGPIDNTNLVAEPVIRAGTLTGEGGRLKKDTPLVQHRDFELVPDSLWKALALWYGGPLPLPRQVIKPPGSTEVELELYPLNLRILRHQSQQLNSTASWNSVVGGYGASGLNSAGISASPVMAPRRYLAHTAAFSRLATVRQVIEFLSSRLGFRVEDVRLWYVRDTAIPLEDENSTLQELGVQDNDQILLEKRNKDLTWPEELGALASGNVGGSYRDRRPTVALPPGATGLHNLGNTCFMNSALQAVSNTRPLTLYFKRDMQLCELNTSNPLGTKGQVARKYAELCRELWAGSTRSVAPIGLRCCVTKHAPHLSGGGQHDSQELLAWLLDALHEDLNRVTRKQYTELRDSDGRPDAIVADEAWQQHLARDHSIITDLFYGQLKSKVTCQTCGNESVRFDAFNLLSLPLPMESYTLCEILVIRLNGEMPVKYGLRLNSEAKYLELKHQLEQLCDIPGDRLMLAEVASSQIKTVLADDARINPGTATELYAYELPVPCTEIVNGTLDPEPEIETSLSQSPLARSPEAEVDRNCENRSFTKMGGSAKCRRPSAAPRPTLPRSDSVDKVPAYLVAVHRKCVRQETYFLSQHKLKPSLFGMPLLLGCNANSTCKDLYEMVWKQVTRLLSPLPQSDQTNHATDCDDSLGYEFPFTLKAVLQGGQICALCPWTQFCRGCVISYCDENLFNICKTANSSGMCVAIDWDPTALHLRYQSSREKVWHEHESVTICRKLHTEPIDLDYCLRAFTSEERLEAKYHCSKCQEKQPATKKLQIWRLPPILIIHLKRFDCVNSKWVKTQKVVNFPFKDFDPTPYLAAVPQETIIRHRQLLKKRKNKILIENNRTPPTKGNVNEEDVASVLENDKSVKINNIDDPFLDIKVPDKGECVIVGENSESASETSRLVDSEESADEIGNCSIPFGLPKGGSKMRERLISTSLQKTPINDEDLKDFHEHKLLPGQDPFDLKYQLYAVVSHSGLLTGGHYISYACNPNGHWYCYNDSSCREIPADDPPVVVDYSATGGDVPVSSQVARMPYSKPVSRSANATPVIRRKTYTNANRASLMTTSLCERGGSDSTVNASRDSASSCSNLENSSASESNSTITPEISAVGVETSCCATDSTTSCDDRSDEVDGARCRPIVEAESSVSLNEFRCAYSDAKTPKIDTSSAYILFYERSGLDYRPYLPEIVSNGPVAAVDPEMDESESELRKQLCAIQ